MQFDQTAVTTTTTTTIDVVVVIVVGFFSIYCIKFNYYPTANQYLVIITIERNLNNVPK